MPKVLQTMWKMTALIQILPNLGLQKTDRITTERTMVKTIIIVLPSAVLSLLTRPWFIILAVLMGMFLSKTCINAMGWKFITFIILGCQKLNKKKKEKFSCTKKMPLINLLWPELNLVFAKKGIPILLRLKQRMKLVI